MKEARNRIKMGKMTFINQKKKKNLGRKFTYLICIRLLVNIISN